MPSKEYDISTRIVALSPVNSVPLAASFTDVSGSALAAAICRLSSATCPSVDVARKSATSPCSSAAPRSMSSASSCSVSLGGFFFSAAGAALGASADCFVAGAGALLAVSPQPAITAAAAASMVQRIMTSSEGTMSEFPGPAGLHLVKRKTCALEKWRPGQGRVAIGQPPQHG